MNNVLPQHHPDKSLLIEYAAGTLDHAQAIAVSAHLHYCVRCRTEVANFERIAGAMMNTAHTTPQSNEACDESFDELMKKVHQLDRQMPKQEAVQTPAPKYAETLPKAIRKMLSQPTKWKHITTSLSATSLVAGQNKYGVSLQKIEAGGSVPQHDHRGTEMTVVLKGSFSDEDNVYQQGDFLVKYEGDVHRPIASSNEDCLCLSVEEAPVKLTGLFHRLLNPFLRINPV